MTEVLLINSNIPISISSIARMPLGIAYLAGYLESEGIDVSILDLDIDHFNRNKNLKRELKSNPKLVGISSTSMSLPEAVKIAKTVKKESDSYTVIGGKHVTGDPKFIESFSDIFDYQILGDGEISITELAKKILKDRPPKKQTIQGKTTKNLEDLPRPAYHLLKMKNYLKRGKKPVGGLGIVASRGCPYTCIYCSSGRTPTRFRNPKSVVEEISFLQEKYSVRRLTFHDENFTINKNHARKICLNIIKEGLDIEWDIRTRTNLVDKKTFKLAKKAGCKKVDFGIETLSEKVQKSIRKNLSMENIKKAVEISKSVGMDVGINIMFGLPDETIEDIRETIRLLKELNPSHADVSLTKPFPGTELFNFAVDNGMDKDVWNKYANGEIPSPPFWLNKEVKNVYYAYFLDKIFLNFPSMRSMNGVIVKNVRLLFPQMVVASYKYLRPLSPIVRSSSERVLKLLSR